ncbi:aminotransferase class I/II-fold pyridoxal phosphate-dependent enzyme [Luteococcus sp. Sow4_B9]|uniref:aminotransferase class I/II-fold pyridoxal phosphate-dependent enzyme n=1 Tax=Luteococcus sp. Sow4_B9 TaxID=3438792 RepID=UPI003F9CD898
MAGDVTIFAQMSALAVQTGALNLGQGFPDDDGPAEVLEAAQRAIREGVNQYPPGRGMPVLRAAIAEHRQRFWGERLDPETQVLVTAGATEAIAASLLALVGPGDEVLTVEPFYDAYAAVTRLAGATHTTVPLRLVDGRFVLDHDELRAAVTGRTRVVLVNNPNNPTGFQWTREDLAVLVEATERVGATIVSDEVYEHLCFDAEHVPVASLPGAFERTIAIGSAGKTFSVTGWKIGWLTAPADLVNRVLAVKQWLTYVNGAPFQPAVAVGLGLGDDFFTGARDSLRGRRDLLMAALTDGGFDVIRPSAGYFTVADAAPLGITDANRACRELAHQVGVVGIPFPAFCHPDSSMGRSWIRFAHCKDERTLTEAAGRLAAMPHPA